MKKILLVFILLLGSEMNVHAQKYEKVECVEPFFMSSGVLSKDDLVCFLEEDVSNMYAAIDQVRYVRTLKSFNRRNGVLVANPIEYIKGMKDTVILFSNLVVSMASRGCNDEVYFFRTTLNGYYRVFMYNGVPRILANGGYVIEPFDENSFDAYYEINGEHRYIVLDMSINHQIHPAD